MTGNILPKDDSLGFPLGSSKVLNGYLFPPPFQNGGTTNYEKYYRDKEKDWTSRPPPLTSV